MSFEMLEKTEGQTVFAPLNTTIDADRDYYDLTALDAMAQGGCVGLAGCGCNRVSAPPLGLLHGLAAEEEKEGLSTAMVISLLLLFSAFVTIKPGEPTFRERRTYEP